MGLAVHAVAGIAVLFAAVIAVRVGIHLGGAFSDSLIGLVALEAGFLGGGLELAVGVAGRAVERGVRTIDRDRGGMSAGCKTKGQDDGCQILIVSVNRLIYIKSLNDFRDFFYS